MTRAIAIPASSKAPSHIQLLLVAVLIFQASVIPDTLGIKPVGRVVNSVVLLAFLLLMVAAMARRRPITLFYWYITPVALILIGYAFNVFRSLNVEALGWIGILLPWMAALSIPFDEKLSVSNSWSLFYNFLLVATAITLLEYLAVFAGMITPTVIETDRGVFLKGIIGIFHGLDNNEVHYRYYGVFAEPGTAAMFLGIGLTYALVYSKKIGMAVFLAAIYLTDSLGGLFSLLATCGLFAIWKANKARSSLATRFLTLTMVIAASAGSAGYFYDRYKQKENSAFERELNIAHFVHNALPSLAEHPFGFEFKGKSHSELADDKSYYGSTFAPYVAFVQGGIISFLGYSCFLLMTTIITIRYHLMTKRASNVMACAFISMPGLLLFVFQRATIFESAIFSFLYASPIIAMIHRNRLSNMQCRDGNNELVTIGLREARAPAQLFTLRRAADGQVER